MSRILNWLVSQPNLTSILNFVRLLNKTLLRPLLNVFQGLFLKKRKSYMFFKAFLAKIWRRRRLPEILSDKRNFVFFFDGLFERFLRPLLNKNFHGLLHTFLRPLFERFKAHIDVNFERLLHKKFWRTFPASIKSISSK